MDSIFYKTGIQISQTQYSTRLIDNRSDSIFNKPGRQSVKLNIPQTLLVVTGGWSSLDTPQDRFSISQTHYSTKLVDNQSDSIFHRTGTQSVN